jgi:hypothetical protein
MAITKTWKDHRRNYAGGTQGIKTNELRADYAVVIGTAMVYKGVATTRAGIITELGATPAVGSIYISGDRMYLRIAIA